MPEQPPADALARPSAAEINAQIRALCVGRAVWTEAARTEWARLTTEWREAAARETALAA
jgi:hypothetical protein